MHSGLIRTRICAIPVRTTLGEGTCRADDNFAEDDCQKCDLKVDVLCGMGIEADPTVFCY